MVFFILLCLVVGLIMLGIIISEISSFSNAAEKLEALTRAIIEKDKLNVGGYNEQIENLINETSEIKQSLYNIEEQLKTTHALLQSTSIETSDIEGHLSNIRDRYMRQLPTEDEKKLIEMLDKAREKAE